jgi:hypothetical protein
MFSRILNIILIVCIVGLPQIALGQLLQFPKVLQTQTGWCWAAASAAVLNYYGINVSQCEVAEFTRSVTPSFGIVNCCEDAGKGCNQGNTISGTAGSVENIFRHWKVYSRNTGALTAEQIQYETGNKHPFIIALNYTAGYGHIIAGYGYKNGNVYYMNPKNEGYGICSYSWLYKNPDFYWYSTELTNYNCNYSVEGYLTYDNEENKPVYANVNIVDIYGIDYGYKNNNPVTGYYKIEGLCGNSPYKIWLNSLLTKGGGINAIDALLINRAFTGLYTIKDSLRLSAADVNADNKVDATDALLVNRYYVKMISYFKGGVWLFSPFRFNVNSENAVVNVKAICVGDVDGSFMRERKK